MRASQTILSCAPTPSWAKHCVMLIGIVLVVMTSGCASRQRTPWIYTASDASAEDDPLRLLGRLTPRRPFRMLRVEGSTLYQIPGESTSVQGLRLGADGLPETVFPLASNCARVTALAIAGDGRYWVAFGGGRGVFAYDRSGQRRALQLPGGPLPKIAALAWDPGTEQLWGVDSMGHRIVRWDASGNVESFGTLGSEPGMFHHPIDVARSPDGWVFVLDALNRRVQVTDSEGRFQSVFPREGAPPLERPVALAVDAAGAVWVIDDGPGAIRSLTQDGPTVPEDEWTPAPLGCTDMGFDDHGRLWVACPLDGQIYLYEPANASGRSVPPVMLKGDD